MATITFNIPDAVMPDFIEKMALHFGYRDFLDEEKTIPNPQTKAQYIRARIIAHWKECYKAEKRKIEEQAINISEISIS